MRRQSVRSCQTKQARQCPKRAVVVGIDLEFTRMFNPVNEVERNHSNGCSCQGVRWFPLAPVVTALIRVVPPMMGKPPQVTNAKLPMAGQIGVANGLAAKTQVECDELDVPVGTPHAEGKERAVTEAGQSSSQNRDGRCQCVRQYIRPTGSLYSVNRRGCLPRHWAMES